ncbi:MAG: long-chain fatty acid--CoA ligase [Gammaproteobacteria bacterium]|nr:long-chain fatty acid--CoA ligase [Gammaproteobacteria bacterium]
MAQWSEDLISPDSVGTLDRLFIQRVHRSGERLAYRSFDRNTKTWVDHTWDQMAEQTARWQRAIAGEAVKPGDRVAVLLRNCTEWVMFDQAAMGLSLVVVPLFTDDRPDNIDYILRDAGVRLLLVQDAGRWKRLASLVGTNACLKRVLILDPGPDFRTLAQDDERVRLVDDWLPETGGDLLQRRGDPHALASIIYTSGTTGRPKGVMLSHSNMLSVAHGALAIIDCYEQDIFLSFLPLSHTLERTAGYYLPVMTGSTVAYSRSVGQLAQDLRVIRPTVMIAVPRIFERVYGRLKEQMARGSWFTRALFETAVEVGWQRFQNQQGRLGWRPSLLLWPLLRRMVATRVKERLGGRLRVTVSGGAALSPDIAKVFIGLDIPILQGYGLTETSPVVSVNTLDDNEPASVGIPLRKISVKIGEDDELLVKGPGVMLGYWNNHNATRTVIDSEGWLHTGDQARIEHNHIYITGRIKDILVLSNGEKVPPGDMELAIALDPLIDQVMVVGEGEPFLTALVVLDGNFWPGLAQECGVDPMDPASLSHHQVTAAVLHRIRDSLKAFPGYAKIRRATLLLEPWTIDNGLLTPTLKVRRTQVLERYKARVREMYAQGPALSTGR